MFTCLKHYRYYGSIVVIIIILFNKEYIDVSRVCVYECEPMTEEVYDSAY